MAVALLWVGCERAEVDVPSQGESLGLSICLPAEETHTTRANGPRRVMGDPGTTEQFELPNYVYIFIMKTPAGESDWTLWESITLTPDAGDWIKTRYTGGLATFGDSIYQYNVQLTRLLATPRFDGRLYIIASATELAFDKTPLNAANLNSLDAVETLKFDASDDDVQRNLQHIYSTPCNYIIGGQYYGFFDNAQRVPNMKMMLYHVAAKVDINWNVADSVRISKKDPSKAVRLTYMRAQNLFNGNAYCFKPMANTSGTDSLASGSTVDIIRPTDEGLWWEGRSYFYTIPYTCTKHPDRFPLQMKMATNDSTKYYQPTIYMKVTNDTTFVPWLRATFNLSKPLTEKTDVKIVD